MKQIELNYYPTTGDVERAIDQIRFIQAHSGHKWVQGHDLMLALGVSERALRKIAEDSHGLIVSAPGTPGYTLAEDASDLDNLSLAIANRIKQIKTEARRIIQLRRRLRELQINPINP